MVFISHFLFFSLPLFRFFSNPSFYFVPLCFLCFYFIIFLSRIFFLFLFFLSSAYLFLLRPPFVPFMLFLFSASVLSFSFHPVFSSLLFIFHPLFSLPSHPLLSNFWSGGNTVQVFIRSVFSLPQPPSSSSSSTCVASRLISLLPPLP